MASVTLMARMVGDAKSLMQAADQSENRMGKMQRGFNAVKGPALVAGGAIAGATMKFAQLGDQIAKMSDRTGFSTEALSEWRFAADQSGASIDGLEVGVRRMQRTIVDADSGLQSATDSFDMIGVSVEELKGLSPEQQFEHLAAAIAEVEDPTLKAAAAQEIFGRQGTALIPLFEAGAEGIAELRQQARDLGIVMDEETAAKAERMNDAINTAQQVLVGMAIEIGATVAPAVSFIAEGFSVLPGIIQKITVVAGIFFTAFKAGILSSKAALVSSGIGIALIAIGEGLSLIGVGASKAADQIAPVAAALERTRGAAVDTIDAEIAKLEELERALTEQYVPALMTAEEAERANTVAVGEQSEAVRGAINEYGSAPAAIDGVRSALEELRVRQDEAAQSQSRAGDAMIGAAAQAAEYRLKLMNLSAETIAANFAQQILAQGSDLTSARIMGLQSQAVRQIEAMQELRSGVEALTGQILDLAGVQQEETVTLGRVSTATADVTAKQERMLASGGRVMQSQVQVNHLFAQGEKAVLAHRAALELQLATAQEQARAGNGSAEAISYLPARLQESEQALRIMGSEADRTTAKMDGLAQSASRARQEAERLNDVATRAVIDSAEGRSSNRAKAQFLNQFVGAKGFDAQLALDILREVERKPDANTIGTALGYFRNFADVDSLPSFDTGGVIPGPRGAPRLVMAHAGETIYPDHKGGGQETRQVLVQVGNHVLADIWVSGRELAIRQGRAAR